jgi:hypothetical protein
MRFTAAAIIATCLVAPWTHAEPPRPQAGDVIVFPRSGLVRLTTKQLQLALYLAATKKDPATMSAMMMSDSNPDGPCWMIAPTLRVRVLSATYQPDAFAGVLEIVGERTKESHGAWVLSLEAKIVGRVSR